MTSEQVLESVADESIQNFLDQAALDAKLAALKGVDLTEAIANIYVVKISPSNKLKRFRLINRLNCNDALKLQFKEYVDSCIQSVDHNAELRDITTNQDNRSFYVESGATDFSQVVDVIQAGSVTAVSDLADLNKFNGYVIQLSYGPGHSESLFAFRYFSAAWSAKNTSGSILSFNMLGNELIAAIDNEPRFQVSSAIDLIQFGDGVFVTNVKSFETAMNYQERLKEKKLEAATALSSSSIISTSAAQTLSDAIGDDKHLMRQLASVHAKGFYADDVWMTKLKQAAESAGNWRIRFDGSGKLEIDEDKAYIKELLTLLQNKRVETVVDHQMFDVDGELIAFQSGS